MAAIYADLKTAMGKVSNLEEFFDNRIQSDEEKEIFIQAVSQVSTDASFKFFAKQIEEKRLDPKTVASFYYHATFAAYPTEQSLSVFSDLLNKMIM